MAGLQEIGEELFEIVSLAHPELAPKLVGMLLQLGEAECRLCLRSAEKLAARLDEAMAILDDSGIGKSTKPTIVVAERRIDPTDGKARTLEELRKACRGQYSPAEIDEYWRQLEPVGTEAASTAKPKTASSKPPPSQNGQRDARPQTVAVKAEAKPAARQGGIAPAQVTRAEATVAARTPAMENSRKAAAPSPPAVVASGQDVKEVVPGLSRWLADLQLSKYADAASKWAEEMGACQLDEIFENLDDFINDMQFKTLEKKRVLQAQGQKPTQAVVSQSPVVPAPESDRREPSVSYYKEAPSVSDHPPMVQAEEDYDEPVDAYESYQNDREQCAREMLGLCVDDFESMREMPEDLPSASARRGNRWG